ncbi:hypothetical protein OKW43_006949 [Paraburkholderia sp. WC7.3g]
MAASAITRACRHTPACHHFAARRKRLDPSFVSQFANGLDNFLLIEASSSSFTKTVDNISLMKQQIRENSELLTLVRTTEDIARAKKENRTRPARRSDDRSRARIGEGPVAIVDLLTNHTCPGGPGPR